MPQNSKDITQGSHGQYIENAGTVVQNNITVGSDVSAETISTALRVQNGRCWEPVSFANQVGLEHAIMGYRLLPSNVASCPKLPQLNLAKNKLDAAHYVFIAGESGCGKSITAYQLAYEYYLCGWDVLKLSNEHISTNLNVQDEKVVFVVDDAQLLSNEIISRLISEANENKKLIITQTKTNQASEDTVLLLNRQAVDAIYNHYLAHKSEIFDLVATLNESGGRLIGDAFGYTSFEFALSAAKREETPWLFNYSLRGGWGNVSYLFDVSKENDRADILLALISLRQIITLDKSVDIQWLYGILNRFGYTADWCDHQLVFLYKQKQVTNINEIRVIHLEMANRVVAIFYSTISKNERDIFIDAIQNEFIDCQIPLLGAVWLYNAFDRNENTYGFLDNIFTDKSCQELLRRCLTQETPENRKQAAFVIERILCRRYNAFELFKDNPLLVQWVNGVDSTTAYAYSLLLNAVNNDLSNKKRFASILDLDTIMTQFKQVTAESLHEWAEFINRLSCFYYHKNESQIANILPRQELRIALASVKNDNLYGAFDMLSSLVHIDQAFAFDECDAIFPIIERSLGNDFIGTLNQIDWDFTAYILGAAFFGTRPNELQKKAARKFAMSVTTDMIVECIVKGTPNDWHILNDVWGIILKYNNSAVKAVMRNIDLTLLDKVTQGMWETQDDNFVRMLFMLQGSNASALDKWVFSKRQLFCELSMPLASLSVKTAEYVFNQDGKVHLIWENRSTWRYSAHLLNIINKYDSDLCSKILEQNTPSIVEAFMDLNFIHCDKFHYFVKMILKVEPEFIDMIFPNDKKIHQLGVSWHKMLKDEMFRKKSSKEYKGFIILLELIRDSTKRSNTRALINECETLINK